jgi:ABC-type uncharacterized transport system substrate-binding protein
VKIQRILLLILLSVAANSFRPGGAFGADVVVLLSKENPAYRSIMKGLGEGLRTEPEVFHLSRPGQDPKALLERLWRRKPDCLVALGDEAAVWALQEWNGSAIILSGVSDGVAGKESAWVRGVSVNLPAEAYARVVKEYLPGLRTLGTVYNAQSRLYSGEVLAASGGRSGIEVHAESAEDNKSFAQAFRRLGDKTDAFLVLFDPLVLRAENFEYVARYSGSRGWPLVVPAFSLLKSGGILSIEPDYEEIGRQTAGLVKESLSGNTSSERTGLVPARKWQVGVNTTMNRSLNMPIPAEKVRNADRLHE